MSEAAAAAAAAEEATLLRYVVASVLTAGGVSIGALWKWISARQLATEAKLEHCETQHDKANTELRAVEVRLAKIEGARAAEDRMSEAILGLADQVASAVVTQMERNNRTNDTA